MSDDHDGFTSLEDALREIERAIVELRFGQVVVKVHQGKVVGIEVTKKIRGR